MDLQSIQVKSSDIDLGEAIVNKARQMISEVAQKYHGRLEDAHVHFRHEGVFFACSVNIKCGRLKTHSAEVLDRDAYRAFRMALDKVATQMRRQKRELREDKAVRVDKDAMLRPTPAIDYVGSSKGFVYPSVEDDEQFRPMKAAE